MSGVSRREAEEEKLSSLGEREEGTHYSARRGGRQMLTWLGDSVQSKEASEVMEEGETGSVFVWTPVGGRVRQTAGYQLNTEGEES